MNFPLPKRIAILYTDARREYFPTEQIYTAEIDSLDRSALIKEYFSKMNIDSELFPGDTQLSDNLKKYKPDFALNLVDSVYGKEYLSASIPGALELLNIPYTGVGIMGMTINTNKYFTKNLLEQWGITTPKYQLIKDLGDELDPSLDFPLITKLNEQHGSIEMDESAVAHDEKSLDKRIRYLMETYKQPIIIEEFIVGQEVTVIVTEGLNTKVYAAQKLFDQNNKYQIVTFDLNWSDDIPIPYKKYELTPRVKEQIKTAFEVLKMEDYAKFDLRVDESGRHYLIDANANPTFGPIPSAISSVLNHYGIDFKELLERVIINTLSESRNNLYKNP